jgi:hypothetical protein
MASINDAPVRKLPFNHDSFERLKDAYEESMDLVVRLTAQLQLLDTPDKVDKKKTRKK